MTRLEAIKRLEWMSWACRSVGSAVICGDDVACLELAVAALREQEKRAEERKRGKDGDGNG